MRGAPSDDFQGVFWRCRLWWTVHLVAKSLIYSSFFSRPTAPHLAAFILPSVGRSASPPWSHAQTCENVRHPAKHAQTTHHGLRSDDLGTNRLSAGGLAAVGGAVAGSGERG